MASKEVIDAITAHVRDGALGAAYRFIENRNYAQSVEIPADVDEAISLRFPGTTRMRDEVGGETNLYPEDGSFRIDVYVRIRSKLTTGPANQDRLQTVSEEVVQAFLGRTISNIEIFRVSNGLDVPAGAPPGYWTDSVSCSFHFEHFGP